MPVSELGGITAEPTDPGPGLSRGELLTDLGDAAVKTLLADPIAPLLSVQIRHLGGAFTRPSDSPHGPLDRAVRPLPVRHPRRPGHGRSRHARKQAALAAALPISGRKPFTFLNPGESAADAFTTAVLDRLRDIKRHRDPHNLFRSNFPVLG